MWSEHKGQTITECVFNEESVRVEMKKDEAWKTSNGTETNYVTTSSNNICNACYSNALIASSVNISPAAFSPLIIAP